VLDIIAIVMRGRNGTLRLGAARIANGHLSDTGCKQHAHPVGAEFR
jgi:hypothetical protein